MTPEKTSIANCNAGWFVIEESIPLDIRTRFEIGPYLQKIDIRHRFTPASRSALVEYFQLEEVIFDGQTGALFKDLVHVAETRYSTPESHIFLVDPDRVINLQEARTIFIGFHAWHSNYYHWITQCVPAMYWACRTGDIARTVFALPKLAEWQEQALSLARLSRIERYAVDSQQQYEVGRLAYTTITQGATTYRPSQACVEVFQTMRSRAEIISGPFHEVIYVSREDVAARKMTNEAELCDRLQLEGVQIVVPGRYSVEEQINMFANAKIIIGPHGAGLTNIAFCKPGAILYEFMSSRNPNPCFANLAQSMGIDYYAEAFPHDTTMPESESWTANITEVLRTLRKLVDLSSKKLL